MEELQLDSQTIEAGSSTATIHAISYKGWRDCICLDNGVIRAIVVPAIGRVMQLSRKGDEAGCFWENPVLVGRLHETSSDEWINFGGDKSWPAPQAEWPRRQGRDWPPPVGFDARPMRAEVQGWSVVLTSEIDPGYGIQQVRRVELDAEAPVMRICTEFHKLSGSPMRVAVWTITQLREPELLAVREAKLSAFAGGFDRQLPTEPWKLQRGDGVLSFARHPRRCTKAGVETAAMVWVGKNSMVRIESRSDEGDEARIFPEGGCRSEIYTNPDPLAYVELETLGPLVELKPGDSTERTAIYTVLPRTMDNAAEEAVRVLEQGR
jgi:hypothetical protein